MKRAPPSLSHQRAVRLLTFLGSGLALAACGGEPGQEAARTVTVTTTQATATVPVETTTTDEAESSEAEVIVEEYGVGQSGESVSYGLVLRNSSSSEDAFDVSVTVNLLDEDKNILATDSNLLTVIPAGEVLYHGSETFLEQRGKADDLEAIIEIGDTGPAEFPLPKVSRVRVSRGDFGDVEVRGEVENTLESKLSSFARIGIVLFDKQGNIVGGSFSYLDADLPPGRRASFVSFISAAPSRAIDSAKASIENSISD
jgi:hypothetical protein